MSIVSPSLNAFDDLLGGGSVLDRPMLLTTFSDELARTKTEQVASLRDLAQRVHTPTARSKAQLPLLKLAQFGEVPTTKGTLRNNANVLAIDGIEGDYDGEIVSIASAAELLKAVDLAAVIYSSPSHTPERPRWRVLCPLGSTTVPEERERLCARLNGALGGVMASESFTLSQSYYFGRVIGHPEPEVMIVDGRGLDWATELDAYALGKGGERYCPFEVSAVKEPAAGDAAPDWERIESALAAIPVTDADAPETGGRELYLRIGQALHHVTRGADEGRERFEDWARGGAKFDQRSLIKDWKSFDRRLSGRPVTVGTLFSMATDRGWDPRPLIDYAALFDPLDDDTNPSRLQFLTPAECASSSAREYVVKGFVARGDLGCIFGAPGAGKSLIAPHIGYNVALGRPVFGMRTKPGRIFYVAAEDPHGMRGRVAALRMRHGDAPDFILVEGVSDLFASESLDLRALQAAIAEQGPAIVFLDTLAMSFPGLEENAAESMNRVVAIGRRLASGGSAVVLIHHDTKAQGPTPRGHSALNGALDVALQLFPRDEAGIVRGQMTKNRNGSCERDIAFRIDTEVLGEDEDGDLVTTALVSELSHGGVPRPQKLSRSEREALKILKSITSSGPADEDDWRALCENGRKVSGSDTEASRKKATSRAIQGLVRKGTVQIVGGRASPSDSSSSNSGNPFEGD